MFANGLRCFSERYSRGGTRTRRISVKRERYPQMRVMGLCRSVKYEPRGFVVESGSHGIGIAEMEERNVRPQCGVRPMASHAIPNSDHLWETRFSFQPTGSEHGCLRTLRIRAAGRRRDSRCGPAGEPLAVFFRVAVFQPRGKKGRFGPISFRHPQRKED